ncbi:transposase [Bacteroidetes bacterium endosymbiont of Geopemphigus sp.]|uniref:transposase n=1 Tax=Bacteroidetes bacterium endosymbiont of Geopemphigus sp. TaxID=2047937 RepID=UPI000CD32B64
MKKIFALFVSYYGSQSKPVHLMSGFLILKQVYNLSDEAHDVFFVSDLYFQYFCGLASFSVASSL